MFGIVLFLKRESGSLRERSVILDDLINKLEYMPQKYTVIHFIDKHIVFAFEKWARENKLSFWRS